MSESVLNPQMKPSNAKLSNGNLSRKRVMNRTALPEPTASRQSTATGQPEYCERHAHGEPSTKASQRLEASLSAFGAKRIRLLEAVARHQAAGVFPLVRELAQELGLAGESSLTAMLRALEQGGFLTLQGGGRERRQRIYRVTAKARQYVPSVHCILETSVPGVEPPRPADVFPPAASLGLSSSDFSEIILPRLGRITAGALEEAIAECGDYVRAGNLLDAREGDFLLEVDGYSLQGDGILDGDWVHIRPGVGIYNGEIAAVQVRRDNGVYESTLKHVQFLSPQKVQLSASNPAYPDIVVPAAKVEIVGAFRGLIRPRSPRP